MSNSLWPRGLQQARLFCPSLSSRLRSDSCPSSCWRCLHCQKWRISCYLNIYQFYHTSFIPDFQSLSHIISIPLEASPLAFLLELLAGNEFSWFFFIWECLDFAFIPEGYLLDIEFWVNGTLKTLFHFLLTPMVSVEKSAVFQRTVHLHEMSHISLLVACFPVFLPSIIWVWYVWIRISWVNPIGLHWASWILFMWSCLSGWIFFIDLSSNSSSLILPSIFYFWTHPVTIFISVVSLESWHISSSLYANWVQLVSWKFWIFCYNTQGLV